MIRPVEPATVPADQVDQAYEEFLTRLVATYSHPSFGVSKYSYREHEETVERAHQAELDDRFDNDRVVFLRGLLDGRSQGAQSAATVAPAVLQAIRLLCGPGFPAQDGLDHRLRAVLAKVPSPTVAPTSKDSSRPYVAPSARAALLATILDQVVDARRVPRFNDYDHLDDIVHIVRSRYAGPIDKHRDRSDAVLRALGVLAADDPNLPADELSAALRAVLGNDHPYVPLRGKSAPPQITGTIGDLFDELNSLKAENNPARFLEINREYSLRQRNTRQRTSNSNPWGLSILGGYEENHHMMLRALVDLRRSGKLGERDEVLVVGSRYRDELDFFRTHLSLPRTIGLDLCDDPEGGIIGGDMHQMPFDSGRFRFLYCAGTLCYSYDMRRAISEFARVVTRPGYIFITDAADRTKGADPLGRSDVVTLDGMVGFFHEYPYRVIGQDRGRSCAPAAHSIWPSVAIELLP